MSEQWIDVSAHNGVIDWEKVAAAGIKGAIIRAGYGNSVTQRDKRFVDNIRGAIDVGLKVAVYWFSYADSVTDAKREWQTCKQVIEPYKDKILFVAYDYEYASVNYYTRIHGKAPANDLINAMAVTFINAAEADGYKTALYTNNDYRLHIFTAYTMNAADYLWLADYTGGPNVKCAIQQTGSTGRVDGISGNVDMDTVFINIGVPAFTCDTSGDVYIERGKCYTAKTTGNVNLVAGTSDVVQIVRCLWPDFTLWHIVPLGKSGQDVGIYAEGYSDRLFRVIIK